jgi:hypothetical protein
MSGEIQRGDYERLLSFIRKDPERFRVRTVLLASPGGDLLEAIKIGNIIKASYQSVFVNHSVGRCASACFLIYVAAVSRSATVPSIGIHRPYFEPHYFSKLSISQAEAKHEELMREVRAYLAARDVPQYLIEKMFALSSNEVYWLTWDDLDQLLVDRCKLNKQLEQGFMKEGSKFRYADEARVHIANVARCEEELTSTDGASNLRKLLSGMKPSPKPEKSFDQLVPGECISAPPNMQAKGYSQLCRPTSTQQ